MTSRRSAELLHLEAVIVYTTSLSYKQSDPIADSTIEGKKLFKLISHKTW